MIATVDINPGTTPFVISCLASKDCDGSMQSSMYRVFDQRMRADFEWYTPDAEELAKLRPMTQEHVKKGGLMLRPAAHLNAETVSDQPGGSPPTTD